MENHSVLWFSELKNSPLNWLKNRWEITKISIWILVWYFSLAKKSTHIWYLLYNYTFLTSNNNAFKNSYIPWEEKTWCHYIEWNTTIQIFSLLGKLVRNQPHHTETLKESQINPLLFTDIASNCCQGEVPDQKHSFAPEKLLEMPIIGFLQHPKDFKLWR